MPGVILVGGNHYLESAERRTGTDFLFTVGQIAGDVCQENFLRLVLAEIFSLTVDHTPTDIELLQVDFGEIVFLHLLEKVPGNPVGGIVVSHHILQDIEGGEVFVVGV